MRIIRDVFYKNNTDKMNSLNMWLPDSDEFDVFIYIHGGGLQWGDKDDIEHELLGEYLPQRNIANISINYRMYPDAKYPEYIEDCAAAVAWVFKNIGNYGKVNNIYVGGSSAGGYLSMMLCFDERWLAPYGIKPSDIAGWFHDAGQPTTHFAILQKERGMEPYRNVIDEAGPLYYIERGKTYSPMIFLVSDNDMPARYEQTLLTVETLRFFGYGSLVKTEFLKGEHCFYVKIRNDEGESMLGKMVYEFIDWAKQKK